MKTFLLILCLLCLLISSCGGTSIEISTSTIVAPTKVEGLTPTVSFTPIDISTIVVDKTSTPETSPIPWTHLSFELSGSYAIISVDKAQFYFPLPQQQEWRWFNIPGEVDLGSVINLEPEWEWKINLRGDKSYLVSAMCINMNNASPQKGSLNEMIESCMRTEIWEILQNGYISHTDFTNTTISNASGWLLVELREPSIVQSLYNAKPQTIEVSMFSIGDNSDPANIVRNKQNIVLSPIYK